MGYFLVKYYASRDCYDLFSVQSCGALLVAPGAVKYPPGNNYLDGVTVTFTCKPEYFIHGSQQRTCVNGSWTPGWHVWCRYRSVEIGLKWMTGILSSVAILLFIASIFLGCYMRRITLHPETGMTFRKSEHNKQHNVYLFSSMSTIVSSSPIPRKEPPPWSPSRATPNHIPAKRDPVPAPSILRHTRSPFRAYETST
ncbi:sushi domain protein [Cooperia oncophora]